MYFICFKICFSSRFKSDPDFKSIFNPDFKSIFNPDFQLIRKSISSVSLNHTRLLIWHMAYVAHETCSYVQVDACFFRGGWRPRASSTS